MEVCPSFGERDFCPRMKGHSAGWFGVLHWGWLVTAVWLGLALLAGQALLPELQAQGQTPRLTHVSPTDSASPGAPARFVMVAPALKLEGAQPPIPTDGLGLWLDAGQGVEVADGYVQAWHDRWLYGNDVSQGDASKQPQWVTNALNGLPAVRFNGTNSSLSATVDGRSLFGTDAGTIYVVQRQDGEQPLSTTFTWQAPNYANRVNLHLGYDLALMFDFGDCTQGGRVMGPQPAWWTDEYQVVEAYRNQGQGVIWAGGDPLVEGTFTDSLDNAQTGELVVGGFVSAALLGEVAEIIVYNRALSEEERTAVRNYLGNKYALRVEPHKPPTVAISSPASGATFRVGMDVRLAAEARDPEGMSVTVNFYASVGGGAYELVSEVGAAPYAAVWRPAEAGAWTIKAVAVNDHGAKGESGVVSLTILRANQKPRVVLTSPTADQVFYTGEAIALEAQATDLDGQVMKLTFYDGTNVIAEIAQPPSACGWSWDGAGAGLHQLVARAEDDCGDVGESAVVDVAVYAATEPIPVAGLKLWLDAASEVETADGNAVQGWADWRGGGQRLAQSEPALQPVLVMNVINGEPVVRFDGNDDTLVGAAEGQRLFSTNAGTIYVVQRQAGGHRANTTFTWRAPSYDNWVNLHLSYNDSLIFDFGDAQPGGSGRLSVAQPRWVPDNFQVFEAYRSGTVGELWVSGDYAGAGQFTNNLEIRMVGDLIIGGVSGGGATLQGDVAELLVYSRALSGEERAVVRGFLGGKYGIRVNPNVPPTATLIAPTPGTVARVGRETRLAAEAQDAEGQVSSVRFLGALGGGAFSQIAEVFSAPFECMWNPASMGDWSLKAVAVDDRGATGQTAVVVVTVLAADKPPVVAWVEPASDTNLFAPADVVLSVSASDPDGTVTTIEFYAGTNLLQTLTAEPYSWTWTGVPAGVYDLSAKAYDNLGDAIASEVRQVRVAPSICGLELLASKGLVFTLYGEPGRSYTVDASEDLVSWELLRTVQSSNGISEFADPDAASKPRRFYRISAQ